jgi:DNA replication protein DnaC
MPERGPIKLPKSGCTIVDDIAYVTEDQVETSALFEVISAHYERRSTLIIAKPTLGEMEQDLPRPGHDPGSVDRLVHHATNVENYPRHRSRASTRPRPTASRATTKTD